jgi:energy-coupling factor transport system ATP-binding protein
MTKRVLLSTKDLVHTYKKGVTALKGINVEIHENDIISIVGQNGSGKTTLVRHFNGLLRPSSGRVYLYGEDTEKQSVGLMSKRVGYVFQNPNHQIFCTTVKEELEVAPRNFGFSQIEIDEAVQRVAVLMNIESELLRHPLTLDYTTKKIVTIASVLAFNPEILILDEPTGGLDQIGREILTKIIGLMHEQGHTVIMISHDMDYVAENSKRVIVMAQGEIIKDGTPEEIFQDADTLRKAQIEPPQITQLDLSLRSFGEEISLSVDSFVQKYKHHNVS